MVTSYSVDNIYATHLPTVNGISVYLEADKICIIKHCCSL